MTRALVSFWGRRGGGLAFARGVAAALAPESVLSLRRDVEAGMAVPLLPFTPLQRAPGAFFALRAAVRGFAPDVHVCAMNAAWAWPLAPRLPGRFVYVAHDAAPHPGDYAPAWQRATQARLIQAASLVVAPSQFTAERLAALHGQSVARKLAVAPLESVTPIRAARPRVTPSGALRLLVAGRMLDYKGVGKIAALVASLPAEGWTLTLAGHGGALAADSFAGDRRVTVLKGWLDDAAFDALFPMHDLLLCPYDEASQSGVLAQAMSHALPALVTPVGALPAQIGEGQAGMVSAGTAAALAEAVRAVLARPSLMEGWSAGALALLRAAHAADPWPAIVAGRT